ncbi:MAG TPA: RHS repeat-associated core domain-containing protein [Phycisphaerae bacterium]|nr:RHS repeat-associated core domain-containing protein [Phycisphaerae bacterium]
MTLSNVAPTAEVEYKILGDSLGASVDQDGTITPGSQSGFIVVRATIKADDPQVPAPPGGWYFKDIRVRIGGDSGGCAGGRCGAGSGSIRNGAIDIGFNLGKDADGRSVGALRLFAETADDPDLAKPKSLYYIVRRPGITVVEQPEGTIRQVLVHEALADVVPPPPNDPNQDQYTIKFYRREDVQAEQQGGLFVPNIGASAFAEWNVVKTLGAPFTLLVTRKTNGSVKGHYEYRNTGGANNWDLRIKNPDQTDVRVEKVYWTTGNVRQYSVENPSGVVLYRVDETYAAPFGLEEDEGKVWVTRIIDPGAGPDNANLTTTRAFYTDPADLGRFKRVKSIQYQNGSWAWYDYDSNGRPTRIVSSWLDESFPASLPSVGQTLYRETQYLYTPVDPADVIPQGFVDRRPRIITKLAKGAVVSKAFRAYKTETLPDQTVLQVTIQERATETNSMGYGDQENLRTIWRFRDTARLKLYSVQFPDSRLDLHAEELGDFNPATRTFTPNSTTGTFTQSTVDHGYLSGGAVTFLADQSTRNISITNKNHVLVYSATLVYAGSAFNAAQPLEWTLRTVDADGHVTNILRSDTSQVDYTWNCCSLESMTDETGIRTEYGPPDVLGRVTTITKKGVGANGSYLAQQDIVTMRTIDVMGRVTDVTSAGASVSQDYHTIFDLAGRVTRTTDDAGLQTNFAYCQAAGGGRRVEVTYPGGGTEITEYYRDGRIKSVSGTGVVGRTYEYGVEGANLARGVLWTIIRTGHSVRWHKLWIDMVSRRSHEERPEPTSMMVGSVNQTQYYYNTSSQLYRRKSSNIRPGGGGGGGGKIGPIDDWTYDVIEGTFINGEGLRSAEFITTGAADVFYAYDELGSVVQSGANRDYDDSLDPAEQDRVSDTESRFVLASGSWWLETKTYVYATDGSSQRTRTNTSRRQFSTDGVDRTESIDIHDNVTTSARTIVRSDKRVTEATQSPASTVSAETVTRNGLVQSTRTTSDLTYRYEYDGLGRRTTTIDPRTGTSTTTYHPTTGQVMSVADAANNSTIYTYDGTGRLASVTNPAGKKTYYTYNPRGQITNVWGEVPQPVELEYDSATAERTKLKTYRIDTVNWTSPTWPGSGAPADTTTWAYDAAAGLVTSKTYADGKQVTYTYTTSGALLTRIWARNTVQAPAKTTYSFSPATGELESITYNPTTTPSTFFWYDRLGRKTNTFDVWGYHDYYYRPDLQLDREHLHGSPPLTISYQYEDQTDPQALTMKGRYKGLTVGLNEDLDSHYATSWTYDEQGRPHRVYGPGLPAGGAAYLYVANSDLIDRTYFVGDFDTFLAVAIREYEQHRDLVTAVENRWNPNMVSKYAYANDNLGRRTSVTRTGPAFSDTVGDHGDIYSYNTRNELLAAEARQGATVPPAGNPITARNRGYTYDPIGNRLTSTTGSDPTVHYCSSNVNAYTSLDDAQNCPSPTQSFAYDFDGNMLGDGQWAYVWDGENRLKEVMPASSPVEGNKKVLFQYDHMNRRIRRQMYTWSSGSWGSPTQDVRYIYDGWNMVVELEGRDLDANGSPDNTPLRRFTWGLDLSGTRQGAGGIGGLLAVEDTLGTSSTTDDKQLIYFGDANGNVGQLVDIADGSLAAKYEYDAYGNALVATGTYSAQNPFRFSTKYCESDLEAAVASDDFYYYGYRSYKPTTGRWMSRDPLAEFADFLVTRFGSNDPANKLDPLGLRVCGLLRPVFALLNRACEKAKADYASGLNDPIVKEILKGIKDLGCEPPGPPVCDLSLNGPAAFNPETGIVLINPLKTIDSNTVGHELYHAFQKCRLMKTGKRPPGTNDNAQNCQNRAASEFEAYWNQPKCRVLQKKSDRCQCAERGCYASTKSSGCSGPNANAACSIVGFEYGCGVIDIHDDE